jgi:hypothetical protein
MRKLAIVTAGLTALAVLPFEASARVVTTSGTHLPSATINCAAAAATLRPYNLEQPRTRPHVPLGLLPMPLEPPQVVSQVHLN